MRPSSFHGDFAAQLAAAHRHARTRCWHLYADALADLRRRFPQYAHVVDGTIARDGMAHLFRRTPGALVAKVAA